MRGYQPERAVRGGSGAPEGDPIGIVLIGRSFAFMMRTWSHVESEFGLQCVQADTVEGLSETQEDLGELKFLIVYQDLSNDLLARWESYRSFNPDASIILAYRDPEKARQVLLSSMDANHSTLGFLPIDASLEVLVSSLRMLLYQQYFLPRNLLADWPRAAGPRPEPQKRKIESQVNSRPCLGRLTSRELEVLRFVSEGDSNKSIARRLGITEHTVKLHLHNLSGKLGTVNRTAAAKLYFTAKGEGKDLAR